jgi:hypothetical protein
MNPTPEDFREAASLIRGYQDQALSMFDAVTAVVSRRLEMPVWTYNHHFDGGNASRHTSIRTTSSTLLLTGGPSRYLCSRDVDLRRGGATTRRLALRPAHRRTRSLSHRRTFRTCRDAQPKSSERGASIWRSCYRLSVIP